MEVAIYVCTAICFLSIWLNLYISSLRTKQFEELYTRVMEQSGNNLNLFRNASESYIDTVKEHFDRIHKQYVEHADKTIAAVESIMQNDDLKN